MKKKLRVVLIVLGVILSLGLIVIFGLRAFAGSIRNQRTCEWANIDNIELHAHVDIPDITDSDCCYDAETNTKKAFFVLNKNELDVDRYIEFNELNKVDSTTEVEFNKFLNLDDDSKASTSLYYRKNSFKGESTFVLFDLMTSRLWVTIEYAD
ncbi:hypothetical protein DMA11_16110 [Marinilabiliaceae bacterium JC017]|nr:hypothetical protein DMA11_16110 [Marinilabiliaceae bacterium JC017]